MIRTYINLPLKRRILSPTPITHTKHKECKDCETEDFDQFDSEYCELDNFDSNNNNNFNVDKQSLATFNVDIAMNRAYERNKDKINSESIRPIGNDIFAYYNSLNILVGSQGKGKSHIVVRDLIQISRLKNTNIHLIVYISKSGSINDSTFEAQQDLIQLPIESVADNNAEKYLKKLDLYKDLYNKYCKGVEIPDNVIDDMFEFLHLKRNCGLNGMLNMRELCATPLNTIIICEDFIKSNLIKSSYFTNFITQLRHKHAIVYVNIQFFKGIPTDYKNNATSFLIFNGFSRQKLNYIYQQIVFPIEFEELWFRYRQLINHDLIYINTRENRMMIRTFEM